MAAPSAVPFGPTRENRNGGARSAASARGRRRARRLGLVDRVGLVPAAATDLGGEQALALDEEALRPVLQHVAHPQASSPQVRPTSATDGRRASASSHVRATSASCIPFTPTCQRAADGVATR